MKTCKTIGKATKPLQTIERTMETIALPLGNLWKVTFLWGGYIPGGCTPPIKKLLFIDFPMVAQWFANAWKSNENIAKALKIKEDHSKTIEKQWKPLQTVERGVKTLQNQSKSNKTIAKTMGWAMETTAKTIGKQQNHCKPLKEQWKP